MRSVAEHLAAVLDGVRPVPPLDVVLADAAGCVLAEDVTAEGDIPALARAGCDGYAVRSADVRDGVELPVLDDAPVTASGPMRLVPGTAILVAAGAPLPVGADAVVPRDRTDRGRAHVVVRGVSRSGEHVRVVGQDAAADQVVLRRGTRVAARHLTVAAAVGRSRLWVHPSPRVVVVTVGDELVEPGRRLTGGATHDALGVAMVAAAKDAGTTAQRVGPVPDDRGRLRETLADQVVRADVVVLTGGLSGGPWDGVADVLAPLGTVRFDEVGLTPGRRNGFGTVPAGVDVDAVDPVGGCLLFALPGHPVAALTSFEMFVRPALRAMAGYTSLYRPSVTAVAGRGWHSPAGLRQVVPVVVTGSPKDGYQVRPVADPDQVSIAAYAGANALAVVPEQTTTVRAGDPVTCMVLES